MATRVSIQLFAALRERFGRPTLELDCPTACSVGELRRRLVQQYPELRALLERSAIAVDEQYANDDCLIQPGQRLALIPPVSGGS